MQMSHSDRALQPCLPLELQDLVLHHLSYDRSVLIRSSLVCKDWRNICLPMVFASIDLSSRPGEKAGARFKDFSQLTRAPSYPRFLAEVQHIKIDGTAKPEAILEVQVERLSRLTSICVAGDLRDGVKDVEYYGAISRQFPCLKRLDLVGAVFRKRSTLLEFLSSFADLQSLALGNTKRITAPGKIHSRLVGQAAGNESLAEVVVLHGDRCLTPAYLYPKLSATCLPNSRADDS
ncbi:hypothetical protein FA13DRAFT_1784330 [Coprinellus micaceus]|uniref:F-box domain-containing protein n=1 Tax=Coprinellus micaceus TaxID=71717 RepID=A0A4Y7U1G8_COPMI|nr:hypothetical protein FA13DRAFT_1784330 [Coprinellus micaceus]